MLFFNSARTSHRSTASQDGQYTKFFNNTIRTRDRHKGDDIITRRGATKVGDQGWLAKVTTNVEIVKEQE